jgi:hypothetical protein
MLALTMWFPFVGGSTTMMTRLSMGVSGSFKLNIEAGISAMNYLNKL